MYNDNKHRAYVAGGLYFREASATIVDIGYYLIETSIRENTV